MRNLFIAAFAATALTAPAFAQDGEPLHFDGFYVGGHFGGAFQPNDVGEFQLFQRGTAAPSGSLSTAGGTNAFSPGFCNGASNIASPAQRCFNDRDNYDYGLRVGADSRMGNFVVGFVVEGGRNESLDSVTSFSTTPAFYTLTRDLRWNANARGRVGFTPGENSGVLFYGTGGVAYGRVRDRFSTNNAANAFAVSGNHDAWGYAAGGGVEAKVFGPVSLGLEFLHTSYNDKKSRVLVSQGTAPATNPFVLGGTTTTIQPSNRELKYNSIRVTAAFHF